ncbi:hypothetical protein WN66_06179 [Saccharomyces cerevisiae]|uniref:Putative uncharacterized membrane protein YOR331C n=2 Tax=Saccharomyces cerevisiae TaxID=4932 RepID=YO331_YEAST|nr:RecName: Full=Putative uncharacterized membrane protein YOR331C [Saccharomyces cerevisiae S288C]AAT93374.1 YOR331C [Saccharomyces cerevisiae]KZV08222.1 hypothetical protein WN66_06179 [Saccharomyces cerevisiae]CAA99653.1 unnamed protein product [Saccharomyces cerevisiae]CAY86612.1 EC1118_1O4_5743p [Saccharomyces cerevisiae EC1118]
MSSFIDSIKSTSLSRALTIALGSNNFKSASTINDCKMGLYSSRLLAIPDNFSLVSSNIPSSDCSRAERTFNLILFAIVDLVICCESMAFFNLLLKLPSMLLVSFLTMLVFSISYSWSAFNWISFAFSSASFLMKACILFNSSFTWFGVKAVIAEDMLYRMVRGLFCASFVKQLQTTFLATAIVLC